MDTFTTIWKRLQARVSSVDPMLLQDFVRDSFNQIAERREWTWTVGHGSIYPPSYNFPNDTASVTYGFPTVASTTGVFTPQMVGLQIRLGAATASAYPTYTIVSYVNPNLVVIDSPWPAQTITNSAYQIFQCYVPMPQDFQYFISMVNLTSNYRVWTNETTAEIDLADPQRTQAGIVYATAFYDYTQNYIGDVGPCQAVYQTGTIAPISTTQSGFTYPTNSLYTIQITNSGTVGTAQFSWHQDAQPFSPQIDTTASVYNLSNGVQIYFPAGTYNAGDIFCIQCTAGMTVGVPRYELWPRPINSAPYLYQYTYRRVPAALTDEFPTLPAPIANRGDVVLELALSKCAEWPGTETTRNPYYGLQQAAYHYQRADRLINELELKDDTMAIKSLSYQDIPFYPAPWLDGSWLQSHAIYPAP